MDSVPNTFSSLFLGYSVIWGILCVYIFSLVRRVQKLERKLQGGNGS